MKKRVVIGATLSAILGLAVAYLLSHPQIPNEAPDISVSTIDGRKIDFKSLQGKPFLVSFWATTCSTCLQEIPHLITLYDELSKNGFEIIGIAMPYDPPNHVVTLSEQKNIPYPIALDINGTAAKAFGDVYATPTSFLINSNGKIVQQRIGTIDISELRLKVRELLNTKEATLITKL